MSNKDKNNTKNADFIDLDNSQFKRGVGFWVKVSLTFSVVIIVLVILIFKEKTDVLNFTNDDLSDSVVKKNQVEEDLILKNIKINKNKNDEFESRIIEIQRNLETKLIIANKKSTTLENNIFNLNNEINLMREEFKAIENIYGNNNLEKKFQLLLKEIDSFKRSEDYKFFFNVFKTAVLSSKPYDYEYDLVLKVFAEDKELKEITLFFEKSKSTGVKDYSLLLKEINMFLGSKDKQNLDKGEKNFRINNSVDSFRDYKNFILDEVKSIIKIKKVSKDNNLNSYGYKNGENIENFRSIIYRVKEYLLIKDLTSAINIIEGIESPVPEEIEKWVLHARQLLKTELKIMELEEKINEINFN